METDDVLTLEQLKCLSSPVRSQVFSALRMVGASSAAELADQLGRSAEAVHFHLKELMAAKLVQIQSARPTNRRPESIFSPTLQRARLPLTPGTEPLVRKAVLAGMRLTERQYEAASKAAEQNSEIKSSIQIVRGEIKLKDEDLEKVMSMIEEAVRYARAHEDPTGAPCSITSIICPIVKKR